MMQALSLPLSVRRILCIGAHVDDIEIGCGGFLLRLLRERNDIEVMWAIATADEQRKQEAYKSAKHFLAQAEHYQLCFFDLPDGYLPYSGDQTKKAMFALREQFTPDLVLTHRIEDRHQDHRLLAELTWNTYRNHLIFEYEIPKYEGDLGHPNVFIPLTKSDCERKIELLQICFGSQHDKGWFEPETFWALLRLRGLEAKSETHLAEAFTSRKMIF